MKKICKNCRHFSTTKWIDNDLIEANMNHFVKRYGTCDNESRDSFMPAYSKDVMKTNEMGINYIGIDDGCGTCIIVGEEFGCVHFFEQT